MYGTNTSIECICVHPGEDDGLYTCWLHHDCTDGTCTHLDGVNEDDIEFDAGDCGDPYAD